MADVDAKALKSKDEKKPEAKKAADKNAKKPAPKSTGFFKSVVVELKKVHWPDKEKVVKYTGVVFGVVIVLGAIIWLLDTAFSGLLSLVIS
jgi:preprotein translocase subunit SecE